MKSKIKWTLTLMTSMYILTACSNSSTPSEDKTDSSANQMSNMMKDSMGKMGNQGMSHDMMNSMNSSMEKMMAIQMTGDFDIDFANMMIEHHQGAIAMSEKELNTGKDEKLKSMARQIITSQKEEIQKLQDFVKNYKPSGMKHGEGELQKSMTDMQTMMKSMQMTGDTDKDFAAMMTAHHEGAVVMFRKELANGMSNKLKQMAQKGINDQTKEIKEFKSWLESKK